MKQVSLHVVVAQGLLLCKQMLASLFQYMLKVLVVSTVNNQGSPEQRSAEAC